MKKCGSMMRLFRIVIVFLVTLLYAQWLFAQQPVAGRVINRQTQSGIAGVPVTDGFSIVQTNAKGFYSLVRHPAAQFVYITIPAGYAIPAEKFLPRFYRKLDGQRTKGYDFLLEKEAVNDDHHLLIVGADPQPASAEAAQKWLEFAGTHFTPVLQRYPSLPAVGILCGDIVGDQLDLYANHRLAVEKMGFPCFQVLGNHDENYEARTDEYSQQGFRDAFGPEYYSFNKGRIHYVVLDDVFYLGRHSWYTGYLNEQQFAWLEKDLQQVPKGATVVVSLHIPVEYDTTRPAGSAEAMPGDNTLNNAAHFYKLLSPYKVHVMTGHTHWHQSFEKDNVFHHIHGAICGAWWDGSTSFDGTPLGFSVYEVKGDSLSWYYQSAGRSRDYQMQLSIDTAQQTVIANVWNWDDRWKVEWSADGNHWQPMQRYIGYSPVMEAYYKSLPPNRPWMQPVLTAHLFKAAFDHKTTRVTVKVTDRFGVVYTDTLPVR